MPLSTTTATVKTLTWDDNPDGTSKAVIENDTLVDLQIYEGNRMVVYTLSLPMLNHIKNVITDIQAELTPAP